jgi:hypothetical protein
MKEKYPAKTECAFYNKSRKECNALIECVCVDKGKCPFFKTRQEYLDGLEKYPPQYTIQ